jgi:hypothetical protein
VHRSESNDRMAGCRLHKSKTSSNNATETHHAYDLKKDSIGWHRPRMYVLKQESPFHVSYAMFPDLLFQTA